MNKINHIVALSVPIIPENNNPNEKKAIARAYIAIVFNNPV